jgi:hypothetical protein
MIKIVKVDQTCGACPSQWDMWDAEDNYYYVRYRWSNLTISIAAFTDEEQEIFSHVTDNTGMSGVMSFEELISLTNYFLDYSEVK